jgi:small conductance mechanosensitive channel
MDFFPFGPTATQIAETTLIQRLVELAPFLIVAILVRRLSWQLARRIVRFTRFAPRERAHRPARQLTLQGIVADMLGFLALVIFVLAAVVKLAGVDTDTVVWTVGLLSAGFGLGARPIIGDILAGASFVFGDTFSVGEKVQFDTVEGVIEQVNLRTTHLRAPSGELCIVPNGEIRVMRNYSRGRFSTADITLRLAGADVQRAIDALKELEPEATRQLPDLTLPWQIISKTGTVANQMDLTLLAKTRFGTGAELRPLLMALVHERLSEAGIAFDP